MSVIAWDGETLAADRQATEDGVKTSCVKIFKVRRTGDVIGSVGDFDIGTSLENWYKSGADPKKFPKRKADGSKLIVVTKAGAVLEYEGTPTPHRITAPFVAWGAGREIAIGAMAMGADAKKAVLVASEHRSDCGMGITAFKITR